MLFGVQYVDEEIEKIQLALDYFFTQLSDPANVNFGDNLFPVEFRPYLHKNQNLNGNYRKYVTDIFEPIFNLYNLDTFTPSQKSGLLEAYFSSNKIEEICGNTLLSPVHYSTLDDNVKAISKLLITLYDVMGDIINKEQHLISHKSKNGKICPVCGLETVTPYDHYFPRGIQNPIYPFSAVNSKNLIPICQVCNGSKSSKLVLYNNFKLSGQRVATYFPYSGYDTWEKLNFNLTKILDPSANNFGKWKVSITLKTDEIEPGYEEKIKHWINFFNIEERFSNDIPVNIGIWIDLFKQQNISIDRMIGECSPTSTNVRRSNGIILQWLFFDFLNNDAVLRSTLLNETNISVNPNDLLGGPAHN